MSFRVSTAVTVTYCDSAQHECGIAWEALLTSLRARLDTMPGGRDFDTHPARTDDLPGIVIGTSYAGVRLHNGCYIACRLRREYSVRVSDVGNGTAKLAIGCNSPMTRDDTELIAVAVDLFKDMDASVATGDWLTVPYTEPIILVNEI